MSETVTDTSLTPEQVERDFKAITNACHTINDNWLATYEPVTKAPGVTKPQPGSRPPTPIAPLSQRDHTRRVLASWAEYITQQRKLILGPRSHQTHDLTDFLTRHADWLARQQTGHRAAQGIGAEARTIQETAEQNHTKRYRIGRCPEHDTNPDETTTPCTGQLWALIRESDSLLPKAVACDRNQDHAWSPFQWGALGKRLGTIGAEHVDTTRFRAYTSERPT